MNPEAVAPSLVIITASTATYIVIASIIGMVLACLCGIKIGRLWPAKAKPAPKPKTTIKKVQFTLEQTLVLARLNDNCVTGKHEPVVIMWQYIGSCLDEDDRNEAMELITTGHKQWWIHITKAVAEEKPSSPAPTGNLF
jgi:hypothetical protein